MKRRDFLKASAGLTGTIVPVLAWGQAAPCPPPSFGVVGGASTASSCGKAGSGSLPALRLTSGAAAGVRGWTVGHAFRKGDAPNSVSAVGDSIQCDVRNRWNDGSVKFAVLSGVSSFSPSRSVQLASGSAAAGTAIPESQIRTALGSGDVVLTLGSYGSVSLKSLVGTGTTASANVAGRVRTASSGPLMAEFHYMGIPSSGDAHLRVWFYVRVYANNDMEVETVVENGWFQVGSPGDRTYSASMTVGTRQVAIGSVVHRHHTRWSRADWVGIDPAIVPTHDSEYLRATRLVPNYGWTSPSSATLDALFQDTNPTPTTERGSYTRGVTEGGYPQTYYGGGDRDSIGILPNWAALWCATTDPRAYRAVVAYARIGQRYASFYRDETTLRPPRMATTAAYSKLGPASQRDVDTGWHNTGASITPLPAVTGSFPADQVCDAAHAIQDSYCAYLATGRWAFIDHAQLRQVTYAIISGSTQRNYNDCLFARTGDSSNETRARGWQMRDCALALSITPDSDSFRNELQTIWANNMAFLRTNYADPVAARYHPAGWFDHISGVGGGACVYTGFCSAKPGYMWDVPWQHWFNVAALAFARDVEVPASTQATSDLATNLAHYSKICAGQTGGLGGWNYRRPGIRSNSDSNAPRGMAMVVGTPDRQPLNVKYSWAQSYATYQTQLGVGSLPAGTALLRDDNAELDAADFDCSGSNFGNLIAATALAASYSPECLAGHRQLAASSTWATNSPAWNNVPKVGIVPRT